MCSPGWEPGLWEVEKAGLGPQLCSFEGRDLVNLNVFFLNFFFYGSLDENWVEGCVFKFFKLKPCQVRPGA